MANKEKADLINGILKYLNDKGHLTDFDGAYNLTSSEVIQALKGLEREGYVKLVIPSDKDEISVVGLTDKGRIWVTNGNLFT